MMEKLFNSKTFKLVTIWTLPFAIMIVFLILINTGIYLLGDPIKTLNNGIFISNHVTSNNLILPVPYNSSQDFLFNTPKSIETFVKGSPYEFVDRIKGYYKYDENYNCQYWSYVWSIYFKHNKDEYNYNLKYIQTDKHVFVMVYNSSEYCILDQINVNCVKLE